MIEDIHIHTPRATRECAYCLSLQGGSVFADFGLPQDRRLYLLRISFDGYGCCTPEEEVSLLDHETTNKLIKAFESNEFESQTSYISEVLKEYFTRNKQYLWEDALIEHELIFNI